MSDILKKIDNWKPPENWLKINTVDAHTGGEPLRIFLSGYPEYVGKTILEKRRFAKENLDHIRTALMWEPRGHADMYGAVVTPPVTDDADFGILFLHNEGYSSMCGHGIIAITKVVLETGMVPIVEPETMVKIDTPSGLVTSYAHTENGKVKSVHFHNVPSYVAAHDLTVDVPKLGKIRYDLAFGGAFYAYVDVKDVALDCTPEYHDQLIEKGMMIKRAVMASQKIEHPFEEDLNFLYGTIFIGEPKEESSDSRNVCVFAEGEVDRSPTGTGVSARMAIHYTRGEVGIGQPMVIESIVGSKFTGRVVKEVDFGGHKAIIADVEGNAFITGRHQFLINPEDPFKDGFIFR